MNVDEPLAFFVTWTVYGTCLQGDPRGWRKRGAGHQNPEPRLAEWRQRRLKQSVILLDALQRSVVEEEIDRLSVFRSWNLWTRNARSHHVHVVVTANGYAGNRVREQFKANCTRVLREGWQYFKERPVWTAGGDWQCVNTEEDLEHVIRYVAEAQDRKHEDHP